MSNFQPTGKAEKELWDKANLIFNELLDDLKSKNIVRLSVLPMDRERLKSIWDSSAEIGKAHNEFLQVFNTVAKGKEFSEKTGLSETTVVQIYFTNLVGLTLAQYESVLKTTLLFFLEEEQEIRRKATLTELLIKLEKICPVAGPKLKKLVDTNLRNSLAHGTYWIENKQIVLADNSYLQNTRRLSLGKFIIESKKINVIAHALIFTLVKKIREGFFKF